MQNGFTLESGAPLDGELELINRQTKRKLSADEVYVFSVVLCDNEIDRDFERFTIKALERLAEMYVGKTGIFDHSMHGRDQVARIFSAAVEAPAGRMTRDGQPYHRLKARAYMPKSEQNESMIVDIDAGIKREVSVGCAVADSYCSICGADRKKGGCNHVLGKEYVINGKKRLCHAVLDNPTDAYEWSFVAVPAQPLAGVVKSFSAGKEGAKLDECDVLKAFGNGGEVTLSAEKASAVLNYIEKLSAAARFGDTALEEMRRSVLKLYSVSAPSVPSGALKGVLERMEPEELKAFWESAKKNFGAESATPQLCCESNGEKQDDFRDFII